MKTISAVGFKATKISAQVANELAKLDETVEFPVSGDKTALQLGGRFRASIDVS